MLTDHALSILEKNYYARDHNGDLIEHSPKDLMTRISNTIFGNEPELALDLFEALIAGEIIFASPVMFNIGLPTKQILAACWVGGLEDSMDSILDAVKETGIIFKYGSGMGLPLTNLRPHNDVVSNSGFASGPLSFMRIYDVVAEMIKSGGKRRAAFMSMNRVDHPDIINIINAKKATTGGLGTGLLENMNISIAVTDEFIANVKSGDEQVFRFKNTSYGSMPAKEILGQIAECSWTSGDPGILFIDTVNKMNSLPSFSPIYSTNPCGEVPLHPYTCCNLGHINLTALTYKEGNRWHFNYDRFVQLAYLMTQALDRIIDLMDFPSAKFQENTLQVRPIGLGFTGYAETLYRLKIPYSNSQSFLRDLTRLMTATSIEASIDLASIFGTTEAIWKDIDTIAKLILHYTEDYELYEAALVNGVRNSTWTMIAPTGTTSLATDSKSYGLEPHFGLVYYKNFVSQAENKVESQTFYINETFLEAIKSLNIDREKLIEDLKKNNGSCQSLDYIPNSIKRVFEVAQDLSPTQHMQIMAAAQAHISSAVSKTINLPNSATVEDISTLIMTAHELGIKGITIYRDGSKEFQPINFGRDRELTIEDFAKLPRGFSIKRGDSTDGGKIDAWNTACTKMYITPGYSEIYKDVLIEVFLNKRSGGGCDSNLRAISLLISLALRKGIPVRDIQDELFSIVCSHCISARANGKRINAMSCPQAIARTLGNQTDIASNYDYLSDGFIPSGDNGYTSRIETEITRQNSATLSRNDSNSNAGGSVCPKCGSKILIVGGCTTCPSCGYGGCDHGRD